MPVIDTGATEKTDRLLEDLERAVVGALPELLDALLADVRTRTPTVDEEYQALMLGEYGNEDLTLVPREGDRSADTDGRVRLYKPVQTYLEYAINSPQNIEVDETTHWVQVGNLAFLESQSYFDYQNEGHDPHTKGPYFEAFETGSDPGPTVTPRFTGKGPSGSYPLTPNEDKTQRKGSMVKPIKEHGMFYRLFLDAIRDQVLQRALKTVTT